MPVSGSGPDGMLASLMKVDSDEAANGSIVNGVIYREKGSE